MNITKREKEGVIIFDIDGELKRSDITDITIHEMVKDQLDEGKRNIILNFDKVKFIDSFGVGEILASYISTHNLGGKLKLVKLSQKLFVVFQVTGLTNVLDIVDDEALALEKIITD